MARIRSLKPEFWTDGKVVALSFEARLLFMGTWNFARCDQGHVDDDATGLQLKILPADEVDAHALLESLVEAGLIDRYEVDGRTFLHIRRFTDHQKVETRWNSRCPYCPLHTSANLAETPPTTVQEGKGKEGIGEEGKTHTSPAPQDDSEFEAFWLSYPRRNGKRIGKDKAHSAWRRLNNETRRAATSGVVHYRKACDDGLTIAKDAHRWLRDREFFDWQEPAAAPSNGKSAEINPYRDWTPRFAEDEPGCSHSTPICAECRSANLARVRDLTASLGSAS